MFVSVFFECAYQEPLHNSQNIIILILVLWVNRTSEACKLFLCKKDTTKSSKTSNISLQLSRNDVCFSKVSSDTLCSKNSNYVDKKINIAQNSFSFNCRETFSYWRKNIEQKQV